MEFVDHEINYRRGVRYKEETVKSVINLYISGYSQNEISKMTGIDRGTISRWLKKQGVKIRTCGEEGKIKSQTYHYNESVFEDLDDPNIAYILGFIMGDGCIHDRIKSKRLVITIAKSDEQILYDIARYLNCDKEMVKQRESKNENEQNKVSLIINSTKICNDLIGYGVTPRKTGYEKFINNTYNDATKWSFIRGLFDADGYIRDKEVIKRNGYRFSITKSHDILNDIRSYMTSQGIKFSQGSLYEKPGCYTLELCRKEDIKKIAEFMYADGTGFLKLNRKHDVFVNIGLL